MAIVQVKANSAEFESIIDLWRSNSAVLGFMPRGGFEDAANARTLLASVERDGTTAGYVLFRVTQNSAVIAHLCVAPARRGTGISRQLFDAVKASCAQVFDVRLSCRRDFDVARMWPKLGFIAVSEKPGRGKGGTTLTLWRYDLASPPLLTLLAKEPASPGAIRAVVDANVFFGLESTSPQDEEARALAADWLSEFLDLLVTDEIFNEINRRKDAVERQRQRARAGEFRKIDRAIAREEEVFPKVLDLIGAPTSPSATSDARSQ